jgi:hypothetical protein
MDEWDPFVLQVKDGEKKDSIFDYDRVILFVRKEFSIKRLDQVRDVFIVSCYTGLAYVDVHLLVKMIGKS